MKALLDVRRGGDLHWVGDGFHVRTLFFAHEDMTTRVSPFLLLDYAAPVTFQPSERPHGVSEHPHRGIETVTLVFDGKLEHGDSGGHRGTIGAGDVQWMTAASGVVHEEWHEREFSRKGGSIEMAQLWVNLPRKEKMSAPRYQEIRAAQIPTVPLEGGGSLRVVAGTFRDAQGPAHTVTPMQVWDLRLPKGARGVLDLPQGNTLVPVLSGTLLVNDAQTVEAGTVALFDGAAGSITLEGGEDARALVLSGEPIEEPVVAYGPFVMNTEDEIRQAIEDYRHGRMGHLHEP